MAAASTSGPGLIARLDLLHAALGDTQFPQDLRADLYWLLAAYRGALLAVEMARLDREVVTSMAQELTTLAEDAQ